MIYETAGWGGVGTLLLILFVVLPSIRWGVGFGTKHGPRWGRRFSRHWAGWDEGPSRREIAELRSELDAKLIEVDSLATRVAELENRLDFTERLLLQRTTDPALTAPINAPSG